MKRTNRRNRSRSAIVVGVIAAMCSTALVWGQDCAAPAESCARARATTAFGKLPLYFVENRGVYDDAVRYYIQGRNKTLYFTDDGVTIALRGEEKGWTVKLDFVGANPDARPIGLAKQAAVFSYFKGPEKDGKAGIPTFAKIIYRDLWPGIDLVYNGTVNKLKYEFVVAPGADPTQIRLRYRGVATLERTAEGALEVTTPGGSFEDAPPVAWQEVDGERVPVTLAYTVGEDGAFGFEVGEYDRTRSLVLDPAVIVYCGYIGGKNSTVAAAAVDAAGSLYVCGSIGGASGFPATVGPDLTFNGGASDAFVARIRPDGKGLVYCGYIGGASADGCGGIAVDAAGNAYVVGQTDSNETSFPVKSGPDLTYNGGLHDVFVAKVNPAGTTLVYCGYIGGSGIDQMGGITVDAAGRAYVCGSTDSTQTTFPVTVGPDLTFNGAVDVFVARINAPGTGFDYCGYLGGVGGDICQWPEGGIAVDSTGNAYVCGWTTSTQTTFPVKIGPSLIFSGGSEAFVAKVAPGGTALVYCGYIGGPSADIACAIAVDSAGRAHVTGKTWNSESTFPVVVGPDLTFNNSFGPPDAFVARVDAQGRRLEYCGYIGGSQFDEAYGIGLDAAGNAYVTGFTESSEVTFPVKGGPDVTFNGGGRDAFVARVRHDGRILDYCGYVGGASSDDAFTLAVDVAGNAYIGGGSQSDENSFPVKVGPSLRYDGQGSAYVAKVAFTILEASGAARPGSTVDLALTSNDDAGLAYQLGSSLATGPIQVGSRTIGLGADSLLEVSVRGYLKTVFAGYTGVIGSNGQATAKINLPNIPALIGQRIHTAFVTISANSPFGIKSISNTYSFTVKK